MFVSVSSSLNSPQQALLFDISNQQSGQIQLLNVRKIGQIISKLLVYFIEQVEHALNSFVI